MKVTCPICRKVRQILSRKGLSHIANCPSCAQEPARKKHRDGLKHCQICKQWKPLNNFGNNKNRWDNLSTFCKTCNSKKQHRYYHEHNENARRIARKSYHLHKDRANARALANYKYPVSQMCEVGGCLETGERHHDDYNNPYEIQWLCRKHHKLLHNPLPV